MLSTRVVSVGGRSRVLAGWVAVVASLAAAIGPVLAPVGTDVVSAAAGAPAPAADEINGVVWLDLDGDGVNDPSESGFAGAVVTLFDNLGTQVGSVTTTASGVYSFPGLDPLAGPFRVDVTRSSVTYPDPSNWAISSTGPSGVSAGYVGTDNDFTSTGDPRSGSVAGVSPGTQLDAAMRPRVELGLGFFGPGVIDGGGGYNALGNCAAPTDLGEPGDDCGPSNDQLRTQDVLTTVWSITADNFEPGTPTWGDVVFEQTIIPTGGAVLKFESIPVACVPPPNGTGGTGAPASTILNNYPVAGQTTLRCNLGQFVEGGQESLTTAIKLSGLSPNGSSFTTAQQVYVANDRAVPAQGPGVGPIVASARPAYDLVKLPFRNLDATVRCVDTDGNPATPCETLRGYDTYTIIRIAAAQKTGVEAITQPVVIQDNTSALLADGVTPYAGFEFYIDECYPNPSGWGDVVLGNNYGYTQVNYPAQFPRTIDNSGSCAISRSNPADNTSDYTFTLTGGDYSGNRYPLQTWGGVDLSAGPFIAVEHRVRVFIPFRSVDMSDGTINDAGNIQVFNQYEGFDPTGVSGVSNYGSGVEPGFCEPQDVSCDLMSNGTKSNNVVGPLAVQIAATGSWQKYHAYRVNDGLSYSYGSGQSTLRDGAMVSEPGDFNYAFIDMFNSGSVDLSGQRVCDVFDNRTHILTSSLNVGAGASDAYGPLTNGEYAWVSAYDWVSGTTADRRAFQALWRIEYASIPVPNSDDPLYNPARVGAAGVIDSAVWPGVDTYNTSTGRYEGVWTSQAGIRCDDAAPAGGWHTNPNSVPGGISAVNAVRVVPVTPGTVLEPGKRIRFNIPFQVLSEYNGGPHDGDLIPAGSVFANFGGVRNDQLNFGQGVGNWSTRNYVPSPLANHGDGDRTTIGRFSSLLQKHTLTPATAVGVNGSTLAGNQIVWEIIPSITATVVPTAQVAQNTKIIDVLPPFTTYNAACTAALNNNPATATILPALVEPNTGANGPQVGYTRLTYNLGDVPANVGIARIRLCTDTDSLAPNGTAVTNYSILVADGDITTTALRSDTHSITLEQTGSMQISKKVDRRLDPMDDTHVYTVEYANFAPAFQITAPTVIDVFPWNGDGPGSLSERDPVSDYSGTLMLDAAPTVTFKDGSSPTGADPFATIGEFTYTADAPATVSYNPDLNTSTWCAESDFGTPGCPASFADVTAFKFVSNYNLDLDGRPRQGHRITFTLNAAGNQPGDQYTNRATIDSTSLPAAQFLRSNNVVVEVASFNLGDRLFADINNNGRFDAGDRPAPADVTVNIYRDGDTTPFASTVTSSTGRYEFTALSEGDYWVEIPASMFAPGAPLYGWMAQLDAVADPDTNANDTVDHDATNIDAGTGTGGIRSGVVTLSATVPASPLLSPTGDEPLADNTGGLFPLIGDDFTNYTVDLALVGTSSIGDRVWFDVDNDGAQDASEAGLNNALVTAVWLGWDGVAGGGDDVTYTSTTSADGNWLITDIPGGNYTVTVTAVDTDLTASFDLDGKATAGTAAVVLADAQDRRDVDFGYTATYTLGNRVFADANHDGNFDAGIDTGIAGVSVHLYRDGALVPFATTVTDAAGNYSFTGLVAGDYFVRIPNAELTVGDLAGYTVAPDGEADPNTDTDEAGDHNAFDGPTGGAMTGVITLSATLTAATGAVASDEPAGAYANQTLDLGFWPPIEPAVTIKKYTNGVDADTGTGPYIAVGGTVTWTYVVTNPGDVPLANLTVVDNAGTPAAGDDWTMTKTSGYVSGDVDNDNVLDVGETWLFEHTGVAVAGQYGNTAVVTGTPADPAGTPIPGTDPVTDDDPSHYWGATTGINIVKTVQTVFDANVPTGPMVQTGNTVRWVYTVTNTGNTTLTGVTVTDDMIASTSITCPKITLVSGETMSCFAVGTATAGQYTNIGTATGTPVDGSGVPVPGLTDPTDSDAANYFGANPQIDVEKTVQTTFDADTSGSGPVVASDGQVRFVYTVTNTGNVNLTNVALVDDIEGAISCPATTLAVGASMECTITVAAVAGPEYVNVATVTGVGPTSFGPNGEVVPGLHVTDEDAAHYTTSAPAINVVKFVQSTFDANTPAAGPMIGESRPAVFTYVVTNIGTVDLTDVALVDDVEGAVTCPLDKLAVGEQMTCTLTAPAVFGDYTNLATVTAVGPETTDTNGDRVPGVEVTDSDPAHYFGARPQVAIVKTVQTSYDSNTQPEGPAVAAGGQVKFTYTVRNTGNVPLIGVVVTDDKIADDTQIVCPINGNNVIGALAVGQTVECVIFDVAVAGDYENTGYVEGVGPQTVDPKGDLEPGATVGDKDPAHYTGHESAVTITKFVQTTFDANTATEGPQVDADGQVKFTYIITNTGDTTLYDVVAVDDIEALDCKIEKLAPGETFVCEIKADAIDAGQYRNVATVTAVGPPTIGVDGDEVPGVNVSDNDEAHYTPVSQVINIETSVQSLFDADTTGSGPLVGAGADVLITYTVTNPGSFPIRKVDVQDDTFGTPTYQSGDTNGDGELDPGEVWVYTLVVSAPASGETAASGSVTGIGPDTIDTDGNQVEGGRVDDKDPHHFTVPAQSIAVVKTVQTLFDANTPADGPIVAAGGQVKFTYTVTNTGETTLTDVLLVDDIEGPITCPRTSLAAGASMVCVKTAVAVTGGYTNTGAVTGVGPATVGTDGSPVPGTLVEAKDVANYTGVTSSINVVKYVQTNYDAETQASGPTVDPAGKVKFTYVVTNTGTTELVDVELVDDVEGAIVCPEPSLPVGGQMTCEIIVDAISGGDYANRADVTGVGPATVGPNGGTVPGVTVTDSDLGHYTTVVPAIHIETAVQTTFDADTSGSGPTVGAGDPVKITYTVTNPGTVPVGDIVVSDTVHGTPVYVSGDTNGDGLLDPTETWLYERIVTAPASGEIAAVGSVTGVGPTSVGVDGEDVPGAPVADSDPHHFTVAAPAVTVKKFVQTVFDADTAAAGPLVAPGSVVKWTFVVTNTGNTTLTGVRLLDDKILNDSTILCDAGTNNVIGVMIAGQTVTCEVYGTAIAAGDYVNTATVSGVGPNTVNTDGVAVPGDRVNDSDVAHYTVATPAIALVKTVQTTFDANSAATGPVVDLNGDVRFDYAITNTGTADLTDVVLTDDIEGPISCPATVLAAGETMTCTLTVPAIDAGQYANIGSVTAIGPTTFDADGNPVAGHEVDADDPAHYTPAVPAIDVEKFVQTKFDADTASEGPTVAAAAPVKFTYVITNTGNVPLVDVVLVDDIEGAVACPKTELAVGEQMVCVLMDTSTGADYTNLGTVTAVGPEMIGVDGIPVPGLPVTDSDPANYAGISPSIDVEKLVQTTFDADTAAEGPVVAADAPVKFTYIVTNTGNVAISEIALVDDVEGPVSCPATVLAAGAMMTCEITVTAVAGNYENTGTVTGVGPDTTDENGDPVDGDPVTDEDDAHYRGVDPSIIVVKKVNGYDANTAPGYIATKGEPLTFTYDITNDGNVTVTEIELVDDIEGAIECSQTALEPGETMTCTHTGQTAPADGQYTNIGTVTGVGPETIDVDGNPVPGDTVTDDDPANAFVPNPAILLKKYVNSFDAETAADAPTVVAGSTVVFGYTVTNTGNVDLVNVLVTDDKGVVVVCPTGTAVIPLLHPGEQVDCTGTQPAVVGGYANVGTATGTPKIVTGTDQPPVVLPKVSDIDLGHYNGVKSESPVTGSDASDMVVWAGFLAVFGVGLLLVGRRRRAGVDA